MAWSFGDGFDLYAATADMVNGYWDSGTAVFVALATGRFSGSRAINASSAGNNTVLMVKSSGVNDAVHHLCLAFQTSTAISGASLVSGFTLLDGTTPQCSILFRTDGAIVLVSGAPNSGTTLATYTGAFPVISTWYQFEIEVVINNTTGSFKVRKNGNPVDDFSATSLNTRPVSANNYANKLQFTTGPNGSSGVQLFDDLFWRSDASSVAWLGDIRCYTRMPATDSSVTFSRSPTNATQAIPAAAATTPATTTSYYSSFIASADGTVSAVTVTIAAGWTGNLKCSVFNGTATTVTTVLASAPTMVNPTTGTGTFTFSTPFTVSKGSQYWIGMASDTAAANSVQANTVSATGVSSANRSSPSTGYSAFPAANPTTSSSVGLVCGWTIAVSTNNCLVSEAQQDALTSYVYSSNPGDADLYGIASIASTPATVIATTTRAYMQKSDAGTRTAAVQLKSGATTVASPTLTLTTSGWLWAWRTDITDPNTGAAWTPAAVNNATIGPKTIA